MMTLDQARAEFSANGLYFNTASIGLPPARTSRAVAQAVERWSRGADNASDFDAPVAVARALYAEVVHVPVDAVAIGSQASVMAGIVAAGLPDDAEVLLATGDFTSVMFPFLAQHKRGVRVTDVPLRDLPGEIRPSTTLVAVSAVQSADGAMADLDAIEEAAAECGAQTLIDITQAAGWCELEASRFDYTVCSAYKWLMAPRGGGFMTLRPEAAADLPTHGASWFGGAAVWDSLYGAPLRLADDARRFDSSPAWLSWIAAQESLQLVREVGVRRIGEYSVARANEFRAALGQPAEESAILSVPVREGAAEAIRQAGLQAALRAGRLRLSCHLHNSAADVARAIEIMQPYL